MAHSLNNYDELDYDNENIHLEMSSDEIITSLKTQNYKKGYLDEATFAYLNQIRI